MPRSIVSSSHAESDAFPYAGGIEGMNAGIQRLAAASMMSRLWLARRLRSLARYFTKAAPHRGMPLAVVIPLDDETASYATKIQVEILRKYGRNPGLDAYPHITLKMGFNATDIAPIEEYLRQLAGETPEFEISIRDFGTFDDGILFLNVEPNPTLENLRQRILSDLSARHGIEALEIEGPQFRFHVTLAYGLSKRDFAELRKTMTSERASFNFNARHIDLYCHTGKQWVTYKRMAFHDASILPRQTHETDAS